MHGRTYPEWRECWYPGCDELAHGRYCTDHDRDDFIEWLTEESVPDFDTLQQQISESKSDTE